jgi:uncharacterized protein (TIGR03437 family)
LLWLPVLLFSTALASAQEQIVVANAASLIGTSTVAPGSMISIELIPPFGDFETLDPTSLNVTILPNGANFAEECGIVPANTSFGQFLNPNQVIAVLPATLALGPAQLMVYHGGLTATAQIMIVPSSLGLFPPSQTRPPLQMSTGQLQTRNQLTHPAQPGDTVTIWATGLGSATQVTVLLGGKATTSSFAGPVSYMPGVDQIQFVVPDDPTIPNDCYVAVAAQVADSTTNAIWLAKTSDGSACQSTLGFTTDDFATLDEGGALGLLQLTVSARIGGPPTPFGRLGFFDIGSASGFTRTESAAFMPRQVNEAEAALISGLAVADDVYFGCTLPPIPSAIGLVAFLEPFDFGNQVTLQKSGGTLNLTSLVPGGVLFTGLHASSMVSDPSQLPPPLFTPGTWTFFGNGTPSPASYAVPVPMQFSVPLTLSPEIMATNFTALQTINRQQDLVVTWNPAGFGQQDVFTVTISNTVTSTPSRVPFPEPGPLVSICKVPATSGQIVIPAAMLRNLTPSKTGGPPTASVSLSVSPRSGPTQTFSLPESMGGPPIHGLLKFTSSENWPVTVE